MRSPDLPPPTLRLNIDTEALAHNWKTLDRLSGTATAGAAVKANAYGVGIDQVAPALRQAGARDFFVAHWSEVPALLQHVPADQVSVLHGPMKAEDAAFAAIKGVRPVINSVHQAKVWLEAGGGPCDLMIDSGINRLGVPPHETNDPAVRALQIDTLLSHLASADEDVPQNARQLSVFREIIPQFTARRISFANSAGIGLGRDYAFDLTRPGIALYGGIPRAEFSEIRQVVFPQAQVLQVRALSAGESVGYNALFTAERDMRVATVSLGYADGFLRCWTGRWALRLNQHELPLLGRVSMDMVVVDASAVPDLREGDWLDLPYDLPAAAERCGLSQYELLTLLGSRFVRSMLQRTQGEC